MSETGGGADSAGSTGDDRSLGGDNAGGNGVDGPSDSLMGRDSTGDDNGDGGTGIDAATAGDAGSMADAAADVLTADGACACQPYWCGCGTCDPAQIACAVNPPPCTRGCASSCVALQQVTCTCDQGRCIRSGVDASTIGCLVDQDCPLGDCCAHLPTGSSCATAPNTCCTLPCP
jgi:hypothetical protein